MIRLLSEYFKKMTSYIYGDKTTNQVLNVLNRKPTTKSYMWVYKTGRSEDKQIIHFIYENTRGHGYARRYLERYHHILQSVGYHMHMTEATCYGNIVIESYN